MIRRYIFHIEFHWWRKPIISFFRQKRDGEKVVDGGVAGTVKTCFQCGGTGHLMVPDEVKITLGPDAPHHHVDDIIIYIDDKYQITDIESQYPSRIITAKRI